MRERRGESGERETLDREGQRDSLWMYVFVCMSVCVGVSERERGEEKHLWRHGAREDAEREREREERDH